MLDSTVAYYASMNHSEEVTTESGRDRLRSSIPDSDWLAYQTAHGIMGKLENQLINQSIAYL
jgi:hypothetical protein